MICGTIKSKTPLQATGSLICSAASSGGLTLAAVAKYPCKHAWLVARGDKTFTEKRGCRPGNKFAGGGLFMDLQ